MKTTNGRYRVPGIPLLAAMLMVLASVVPAAAERNPQTVRVNADAATLADFAKRVEAYAALHRKVDGALKEPSREGSPEDFRDHERAFAKLMQKERPYAKQGDILTKPMRNVVRRLLVGVFRGPEGRQIKNSILDEFAGKPLQGALVSSMEAS